MARKKTNSNRKPEKPQAEQNKRSIPQYPTNEGEKSLGIAYRDGPWTLYTTNDMRPTQWRSVIERTEAEPKRANTEDCQLRYHVRRMREHK